MNTTPQTQQQKKLFYIDMHMHTAYSDGSNSPAQNVIDAAIIGIQAMAITDHDNTRGYKEAKEEADKWGVTVIPGVEITTEKYHILGYDFNRDNIHLRNLLEHNLESQDKKTMLKVNLLRELGIPITFEKVKKIYPYSRLGKLNLLVAMMQDPDCRKYHGLMSMQELYNTYFSKKSGSLVYLVQEEKDISSKDAISAIHEAGGLAVIAHPFKEIKETSELDRLVEEGIDGLEIQPNYNERNIPFKQYAEEKKLLITYGSDYHGARKRSRPLLSCGENIVAKFWN